MVDVDKIEGWARGPRNEYGGVIIHGDDPLTLCAELRALRACVEAADKLASDVKLYGGLHLSLEEAERIGAYQGCNVCDETIERGRTHRENCALVAYDAARAKLPREGT